MRLRTRLALATMAAAVPMVAVLVWIDGRARHDAAADALIHMADRWVDRPGERERCEADPDAWSDDRGPPPPHMRGPPPPFHGPPPGPVEAPRRRALAEDDPLGRRAENGSVQLPAHWWNEEVEVVVRTPWGTGPCAYVYVHGTTTRGFIGAVLPSGWVWLLPVLAVMAAVLVAIGPVVQRLRRLIAAVASSGAIPIDGRDEITELARAFDDRERALRDFLANTTHDVMIPLSVLLAHLATLQQRPGDDAILTAAMDEAHYMGALLHNLSAAAKLDAAAPTLGDAGVDLGALLSRVIARHRPIAARLEVEIDHASPEAGVTTRGDVTLIEQAVSNLVYNAVRHNRAGGHVAVILDEVEGGRFRIRVIDDGPGLPADQLSRMAERGFRGDAARSRSPEGQGLGLDIALRVAERHGFSLRFGASEYGGLQVDLEGPASPA